MRWRTREQHQEFPRVSRYLADLPRYLTSQPRVMNAFKQFSGFNDAEAMAAATLGNLPLFRVVPITINGQRVTANGSHSNGLITIDIDIGAEVEQQRHLTEGAARILLYATSLHELVHYGRHQKRLPLLVNRFEAGKMFECSAYQGDINWDGESSRLSQSRRGRYQGVDWDCPMSTLQPGVVRLSWTPGPTP